MYTKLPSSAADNVLFTELKKCLESKDKLTVYIDLMGT